MGRRGLLMGIPSIVETVLKEYITLFNEYLPGELVGVYIHGSIALNAYVDDSSDIDFITVTDRRLTEKDLNTLSFIHTKVANKFKRPEMDGVYIIREDVGKLYNNIDFNYNYPYYNDGILTFGDYFNFNPITWWVFQNNGINILGPKPTTFQIDIQSDQLYSYVLENMNSYWANRIQMIENSKEEIINLPTDIVNSEIEWTILGLLRQFYTLKENDIISKMDAGEYGLQHIPEEWHEIIKEAMNIRNKAITKAFDSNQERINSVIGFSKYLIRICN